MDQSALDLAAYRSLASGFPSGSLALLDTELRFIFADGELIKLSGLDGERMAGQRITDLFPPRITSVFVPIYLRALAGEAVETELTFGTTVLRHLVRPVRDREGRVFAAIALTLDITLQVGAMASLGLAERRLRALVELGKGSLLLLDHQGRIREQGPSAPRVWGWTPAEVVGQDLLGYVHVADRGQLEALVGQVLAEPAAEPAATLRVRHRDGSWRWIDAHLRNLLAEPAVAALVFNFHDATLGTLALEALRLVGETTAALSGPEFLESLCPGLAGVLDVQQVLIARQAGAGRLETLAGYGLGPALDPALGRTIALPEGSAIVRSALGGQEVAEVEDARARFPGDPLLEVLQATSCCALPLRMPRPSGAVLGLLFVAGSRAMPSSGHWLGILRLFASRIAAELVRLDREHALRRSEELNRQLLESLPNGLVQADRGGAITRTNALAEEFLGLASGGRHSLADFAHRLVGENGASCDIADLPLQRCLALQRADGPRTLGVRRAEGISWGVFSATPLRDASGAIDGAVMCFLDISERKGLEDQLRHSQKMDAIGKLAGGVAHDFNNLLTVILGRSELLLDRLAPDDKTREDIKLFHSTASRASGLTRQLLAISRQQVADPRVVDVNLAVQHMTDLLRGLLGEHIELRSSLEPRLGRILADPTHIEQVVLNLVVNARDAMPDGGMLTIHTANAEVREATADLRPGRYVLIAVRDTGVGIDPRIQSRVFEPFFTTKTGGKGTGLGLSTVFGIARQHGGSVTLRSEPGKGTTFFVYLPRRDQLPDPSGPHPVLGEGGEGRDGHETILLAEDHDELRTMLEGMLSARGYHLLAARDGREALAIAESAADPIDLLVTDVVMPGMGGRELARRLSARSPAVQRVLYVSGYTDEPMATGRGSRFLQKPFSSDTIARTVRELLDGG